MDAFDYKRAYIDAMRASLRAAAAANAAEAERLCRHIGELGLGALRDAESAADGSEREMLLDVAGDAVSFLVRSAEQAGQLGPNQLSGALRDAAGRIVAERRRLGL